MFYHVNIESYVTSSQRRLFVLGRVNTTFPINDAFQIFLLFEDKGRLRIRCSKLKRRLLIGTPPFKRIRRGPSTTREHATTNPAYLIAGLVIITQFPLVHRMLQGVKHTDPTEWSNLHLSIGDKFMLIVS